MFKEKKKTNGWSARDKFNAVQADALNRHVGQTFTIAAMALGEDVDKSTGETLDAGYIRDTDGKMYTTVSSTTLEQLYALMEIGVDTEPIAVKVCENQCLNSDSSYIYLDMA